MASLHRPSQRFAVQTGYGLARYLTDHDTWAIFGDPAILLFDSFAAAALIARRPTNGNCALTPIAVTFPPEG
jgi:hypothetical protein